MAEVGRWVVATRVDSYPVQQTWLRQRDGSAAVLVSGPLFLTPFHACALTVGKHVVRPIYQPAARRSRV